MCETFLLNPKMRQKKCLELQFQAFQCFKFQRSGFPYICMYIYIHCTHYNESLLKGRDEKTYAEF